jgi:hypothetical protein
MPEDPIAPHYSRFLTKWRSGNELRREKVTLILSPHIDDAFLSLGSSIESGALGRNIIAVNVFTLSDSRIITKTRTDFSVVAATSIERMQEELAFADYLSTKRINYIPIFLGLKDAALDSYYSHIASSGIRHLPSAKIKEMATHMQGNYIRKRMQQLHLKQLIDPIIMVFRNATLLAPLGIGDHIDHALLRAYAAGLSNKLRVGLYADIPYIYHYGLSSFEKLRAFAPKRFAVHDVKTFKAIEKNRLFKSFYKSQYDQNALKAFREISKSGGETIFWNR